MKLEIIKGDDRREFSPPADAKAVSVGRGPANELVLDEKGASRKHFTLERAPEGWKVVDQLSSNGTLLNGEKVNFAFLKDGDQIRVGGTIIKVSGIGPAKPMPKVGASGRAAPISARHPAPLQQQAKGPGLLVGAVAVAVLALGGGAVWFLASGRGGETNPPPDTTVAGTPRRTAELSEADQKVIAQAQAIVASDASTVQRLTELDALREKFGERGVVASRLDEMRAKLRTQLESELSGYVSGELDSAKQAEQAGDHRKAVGTLERLAAHLAAEDHIRTAAVSSGLRIKAESALAAAVKANEEFILKAWSEADRLAAEKLFDDAITLAEDMLRRAHFKQGERELHEMKVEDLRTARRTAGDAKPPEPVVVKPSILDSIKGPKAGKLPGANPLLPEGSRSEAELMAALKALVIEAINNKRLASDKVTYMGDVAVAKSADAEKITLGGVRQSKGPDGKVEAVPYTKHVAWTKLETADLLALYDATPKTDNRHYLAVVVFLFERGLMEEGCRRAFQLYQRDNSLKEGLDNLVATKRKIAIPDGGFVEFEGMFVTPEEKEGAEFSRRLREVLSRFEKGLGHKDKKKREESDAAFAEMLKMGERAIGPGVKIMNEIREKEIKKLEEASGILAADDAKLRELKAELDRRRKYALELILDTVKYPYPYAPEPEKSKVQAEVDARVAAVKEIWEDPLSFKGTPTADVDAIIERVQTLVKRMGQLDREQKHHTVTPETDLQYLRELVGKALSIKNYVPKGEDKLKELIAYNAEVMRYNENFPVGDGHCDGDCRASALITNRYRMMFELHAVKLNDKLFWAAKHHSKYQVTNNGGQISHNIPGEPRGESFDARMRYEGYNAGGSENIAARAPDSTAIDPHNGWVHSSGHHRNILTPAWRVIGVGKHRGIWTQLFGSLDEGDGNMESRKGT